ncbi:MAG: NUDIX domain-containing protein [Treponema sp.]|jgi:ADP-ribose pyrophosphatase YjhB (NUDIX family)|nr:NUDIX domain-containing protein [Treponema sp.]
MERKHFPVAVHLFLLDGENILLLKRYNTGYEDGNYSVIAGHLDGNEDVYNAMIREAKEEAGIDIELKDIKIVQVMHRKKPNEERIDYFFCCNKWSNEVKNAEPEKCSELKWYPIKNLPENTIEYIKFSIKNFLEDNSFTLFGW